ncbi:tetratricopeptide repeat protein [Pelagicoccus sp. SDUM812002]|uniref:tetratricopeptide repeat protein n=1 Tax=Pelagicoccus sp. SDUM812002 TaxID=3041266 RepID=UPI00280DD0C6|nr:tetratricopeptide repeat protein [Pelagicoccus sp. SDUM812002]MDQ8184037.1 tetratricopeptide repeat protein [Pelagicoccus sp. SDUM812002]
MKRFPPQKSLFILGSTYLAAMAFIFGCTKKNENKAPAPAESSAVATVHADWRQPETCLKCHEDEHKSWIGSHHADANRFVDTETDAARYGVGEFKDVAGREYRVSYEGGDFLISERNPDGDYLPAKATAVIGVTPLQQPLVEGERGRLQAHAMAWDPDEKEWFNVFGDEERLLGEWGHWSGQGMNWNSNCAWCHTTEYEKNYDPSKDSYASSWTHQGISCIACHSDMKQHVATIGRDDYEVPASSETRVMMENCASCHSRREELSEGGFEVGESFEDHYRVMLYDHPTAYFPDGKANEENFVWGSFMHSRMGHAGVSCMDCHDPHSATLKFPADSNATCIQCHSTGNLGATIVDLGTHSRHPIGSDGDSCVACHMPEREYMARDPRRDHGFTIPDPYMAKTFGAPDACTSCHQDLDADHLLSQFDKWWGDSDRVTDLRDRAHLLSDTWSGELESPEAIIARLKAEENPYWRASWLRMLRDFSHLDEVRDLALEYKDADQPILRDVAIFLLGTRADGLEHLQAAAEDSSRIVRMQVADTLAESPYLSEELRDEYNDYLQYNADRPSGALKLASQAASEGNIDLVKQYGELAISFDRKNAAIRYDVSILYDRVGLGKEAIKHLRIASAYEPNSGLYPFSIGLLLAGQGQLVKAVEPMQRALKLDPNEHRWWYNISIIQTRLGDLESARASLQKALDLAPQEPSYLQFMQQLSTGS